MLLNLNDAKDLLTLEAIKEHCDIDLDEPGTVQIYLDDLKIKSIDVIGWTEDELFEDFKLWFEDDYTDDSDHGLEALLDGSRSWPDEEEFGNFENPYDDGW